MQSPIVIKIENLGKQYRLGEMANLTRNFREVVSDLPKKLLRRATACAANPDQDAFESQSLWALKEINLEIRSGEVVGIIGANGAGKSTLLKILSRITTPTEGQVRIQGRVSSLLEVGTGMHPELTGRENIFLNGVILGMRKKEIEKKLDDIIAFSGIEKFLDTPVKRYSSGMKVRLAFAVAAHLEPEIIIIDEVLAVGDIQFQAKCLGKMEDVVKGGRTVLFVSHNIAAIKNLCQHCVWLEKGRVKEMGLTGDIVPNYLSSMIEKSRQGEVFLGDRKEIVERPPVVFVRQAAIRDAEGRNCGFFKGGDDIVFDVEIQASQSIVCMVAISIRDLYDSRIVHMVSTDDNQVMHLKAGVNRIRVKLANNRFNNGKYYASVWVGNNEKNPAYDFVKNCLEFMVDNSNLGIYISKGLFRVDTQWQLNAGSGT